MVGYRSPPPEHQFKKGESGNPLGRPRGSKRKLQKRISFLDELVTIKIEGRKRKLPRREALMQVAAIYALQKNNLELQRLLITLKDQLDDAQEHIEREVKNAAVVQMPWPKEAIGCIEDAADVLGFGKKVYQSRKTARVLLETWFIQAAFERLGDDQLSRAEQEMVLAAARFPGDINWPEYWQSDLRARSNGWRAKPAVRDTRSESGAVPVISVAEAIEYERSLEPKFEIYWDSDGEWKERWVYPEDLGPKARNRGT